jgi:hypothetical protein
MQVEDGGVENIGFSVAACMCFENGFLDERGLAKHVETGLSTRTMHFLKRLCIANSSNTHKVCRQRLSP